MHLVEYYVDGQTGIQGCWLVPILPWLRTGFLHDHFMGSLPNDTLPHLSAFLDSQMYPSQTLLLYPHWAHGFQEEPRCLIWNRLVKSATKDTWTCWGDVQDKGAILLRVSAEKRDIVGSMMDRMGDEMEGNNSGERQKWWILVQSP